MSKKPKDYRKVRAIKGTIFDRKFDGINGMSPELQRRCGLYVLNGINPRAVTAGGTSVESLGGGRVRVYYEAIYLPPEQSEWPGGKIVPLGIECHHGGYKKRHPVRQIRHFDANLSEVL